MYFWVSFRMFLIAWRRSGSMIMKIHHPHRCLDHAYPWNARHSSVCINSSLGSCLPFLATPSIKRACSNSVRDFRRVRRPFILVYSLDQQYHDHNTVFSFVDDRITVGRGVVMILCILYYKQDVSTAKERLTYDKFVC